MHAHARARVNERRTGAGLLGRGDTGFGRQERSRNSLPSPREPPQEERLPQAPHLRYQQGAWRGRVTKFNEPWWRMGRGGVEVKMGYAQFLSGKVQSFSVGFRLEFSRFAGEYDCVLSRK